MRILIGNKTLVLVVKIEYQMIIKIKKKSYQWNCLRLWLQYVPVRGVFVRHWWRRRSACRNPRRGRRQARETRSLCSPHSAPPRSSCHPLQHGSISSRALTMRYTFSELHTRLSRCLHRCNPMAAAVLVLRALQPHAGREHDSHTFVRFAIVCVSPLCFKIERRATCFSLYRCIPTHFWQISVLQLNIYNMNEMSIRNLASHVWDFGVVTQHTTASDIGGVRSRTRTQAIHSLLMEYDERLSRRWLHFTVGKYVKIG